MVGQGEPIPTISGNNCSVLMKDNERNVVVTKLDPAMLQQIASAAMVKLSVLQGKDPYLPTLPAHIAGMEKRQYSSKLFTDYVDWFQCFLGAAIFDIIEFIIAEKKNK